MGVARIGMLGVLALAPALFGCAEDVPQPSLLSPAPAACQQEAQRLGFILLGAEGAPELQTDGSSDYPILVQWGNDGGVHLHCRLSAGGVVIG
ncbi:MAG: hypothetical protein ACREFI_11520 [Stellaceae bacterium]